MEGILHRHLETEMIEDRMEVHWKISDFFSLRKALFCSDSFLCRDDTFKLGIIPNSGIMSPDFAGWVGVHIMTNGPESFRTWAFEFTVKGSGEQFWKKGKLIIQNRMWGIHNLIERSDLVKRRYTFVPSDVLTIIVRIKEDNPRSRNIVTTQQLETGNLCWLKVLEGKKHTDIVLKVKNREFPAHRFILESRSPVFSAMLQTDVVNIEDINPDAFLHVLRYIYSGSIGAISYNDVFGVYAASIKYDFPELRQACKRIIEEGLSIHVVCDVIKFADLYSEELMAQCARQYFKDHLQEVLKTDHWKRFAEENKEFSLELTFINKIN